MEQHSGPTQELSRHQGDRPVPWTLGDILVCIIGGVFSGFLALFPILFVVSALFDRPSDSVIYAISGGTIYLLVVVFVWQLIVKRRAVSWEEIGFKPVRISILLLMLPLSIGLLFLSGIIAQLTTELFGDVPDAADQLGVTSAGLSITDLVCLLIIVGVIGPVVEEMVFRGLLHKYVRARRGLAFALFVTSLAFAATHFIPVLIPVFIAMGYAFGLVAETTKSLYPAIAIHALNNVFSTILVYWTVG